MKRLVTPSKTFIDMHGNKITGPIEAIVIPLLSGIGCCVLSEPMCNHRLMTPSTTATATVPPATRESSWNAMSCLSNDSSLPYVFETFVGPYAYQLNIRMLASDLDGIL